MITAHTVSGPDRVAAEQTRFGVGITIYGCELDEAAEFRAIAPKLGVRATITAAPLCEATARLAGGNRCVSIGHKSLIDAPTLLALTKAGVRYVSTRSVGLNHIDTDCAKRLGITVEPVAYSPDSVADYTLMLMLMALRHARRMLGRVDVHDYRLHDLRGRELRDLTVGVLGTGRIGAAVIDRLAGFGGCTLAYDVRPKTSANYVSLDVLTEQSDIVTLHTPLCAETYHLLDRPRIARMKAGAVIVNTGRGQLLDTEALVAALESGRLGGAALDVVEGEDGIFYTDRRHMPIQDPLWLRLHALPNVVITPHTAYYTDHALSDTIVESIRNCVRFEREQGRG